MASKKMKRKCKNAYLDQSYLKDKEGKGKGWCFFNKAQRKKLNEIKEEDKE